MGRRRVDAFAVTGGVLAGVMLAVYVVIVRQQQGELAAWAVLALAVAAVAACYGAALSAPGRRVALGSAAFLLLACGLLALLTIGLPILAAGVLCLVAAVRSQPAGGQDGPSG